VFKDIGNLYSVYCELEGNLNFLSRKHYDLSHTLTEQCVRNRHIFNYIF